MSLSAYLDLKPANGGRTVEQEGTERLQLTAEDYLQGVIGMVNELVRASLPSPDDQIEDGCNSHDYR